jgi:hypothetical protein
MAFRPFRVPREVGDPHVPVAVRMDAVRCDEESGAEVREHFTRVPVELEDRVDEIVLAVERARPEGTGAAALVRPDVAVRRIDIHAG